MTAPPPPKPVALSSPMQQHTTNQAHGMMALGQQAALGAALAQNQLNPHLNPLMAQPAPTPKPIANIAKAISAVMSEIGVVAKEGTNKFHNYKYATIGDVLHKLTPLLGKHGLMIVQNEVDHKTDQRHIAVTYEFTIAHSSGEVWPDKPRKTGMSIAVDSKGSWDDKAFNKAATAARKYFLLELFQVPTGDMEDADSDANTPRTSSDSPARQSVQQAAPAPPPPPPADESKPHRIVLGKGAGPEAWTQEFIRAIGNAAKDDEVGTWQEKNSGVLNNLQASHPDLYDRIIAAAETRLKQLNPIAGEDDEEIPDPSVDPDVSIQYIAQHLADMKSQEELETWWNQNVSPMEDKFFPPDFTILVQEFERAEARLKS